MSDINLEPALFRPSDFRFGEVSSLTTFRDSASSVPSLGPLAAFTGAFHGSGFNTIFRPDLGSPTKLPVPVTGSDNVLELNLTRETLSFSPSLGSVPNRGEVQADIFLNGVPYLQVINDVTVPGQPVGIHFEPGLWMAVPATTDPRRGDDRHAHGVDSRTARRSRPREPQSTIAGKPDHRRRGHHPVHRSASRTTRSSSRARPRHDKDTARIPQDLTSFIEAGTITQAMLDDPNTLLRNHIASQNITSTTAISSPPTRRPAVRRRHRQHRLPAGRPDSQRAERRMP